MTILPSLHAVMHNPKAQQTQQMVVVMRLEDKSGTLGLLVTTELEVLAALERELCLGLAVDALESQYDLLGCLGLLVENWLGLTSVTGLLAVVTTLTLREEGGLRLFVRAILVEMLGGLCVPCQPCTG